MSHECRRFGNKRGLICDLCPENRPRKLLVFNHKNKVTFVLCIECHLKRKWRLAR